MLSRSSKEEFPNKVPSTCKDMFPTHKPIPSQNLLASTPSSTDKIDPLYVSLLINGYYLNNYIIDSSTFDNFIPTKVFQALSLSLSQKFCHCSKSTPLFLPRKSRSFLYTYKSSRKLTQKHLLVTSISSSQGRCIFEKSL